MQLKAAIEKYLEAVKEFGRPMPLALWKLPKEEVEAMVSAWDEDYHLHRHFELIPPPAAPSGTDGGIYLINGHPTSAIALKESILHVFE